MRHDGSRAASGAAHHCERALLGLRQLRSLARSPAEPSAQAAPVSFLKWAHPDGELAVARAAAKEGAALCLSSSATTSLEDVAAAAAGAVLWFQLYVFKDRELTLRLVRRAERAGYRALVVTVDHAVLGNRERVRRHEGFAIPAELVLANLRDDPAAAAVPRDGSFTAYVNSLYDQSLTWADLAWLVKSTTLPVVVKGIVHPLDAAAAVANGARGVVVSNHGGRQLDGCVATAAALPAVVAAVAGRAEVYVDGGVRRGVDVLAALAMGARAVLVGRPLVWALSCGGEAGVRDAWGMLRRELVTAMALCGSANLAAIARAELLAGKSGDDKCNCECEAPRARL